MNRPSRTSNVIEITAITITQRHKNKVEQLHKSCKSSDNHVARFRNFFKRYHQLYVNLE